MKKAIIWVVVMVGLILLGFSSGSITYSRLEVVDAKVKEPETTVVLYSEDTTEQVDSTVGEDIKTDAVKKETSKSSSKFLYGCDHEEMGSIFSFQFENSTAASYIKPYCKNCDTYFGYNSVRFRGTPNDLSYLDVIRQYVDRPDIEGGKYYTMTANVLLGDYDIYRTRIKCEVERDGIVVCFSVEFQEEFEERVSLLQKGDEITFRGRLYDEGFGWTDCELLEI